MPNNRQWVRRAVVFLMLALGLIAPGAKSLAAALTGEFLWVHDPSRITKCNGKYFVYHTGDKVLMRYSTNLTDWKNGKAVLDRVPDWAHQAVPRARGEGVWAPDVLLVNKKYCLFYSYSTFGSRTSVIGLVTSPTLDPDSPDYKWTDQGLVIASTDRSRFNAIDPCPVLDAQGDLWLTFGSWNRGGIQLVKLDKTTGKPVGTQFTLAAGQRTGPEAPYLHFHGGFYYLFENEGLCCKGMNSTYKIMMGRAKTISGPYLDRDGKDLAQGGGTLFLGTDGEVVGPGHIGIVSEGGLDRFSFHYYGSRVNGVPTLGLERLAWGADGWPRPGGPGAPPPNAAGLAPGRYAIISKASGLALGVHDILFDDGTPIDQFTYSGGDMQIWNVCPVGDGFYGISSLGTGKFFDLFECSPKDGAKISQYPWMNNDCQRWRIEPAGKGAYQIISKGGGTALTLPAGTNAPQALVVGSAWKGDSGQQWIFQKIP